MTVYFSFDVETTGPVPSLGSLLSVGVWAFESDPDHGVPFYATIKTGLKDLVWHGDTKAWWEQQNPARWREARVAQMPEDEVAFRLAAYVEYVAPEPADRCFVANPVSFDWPWINDLLLRNNGENPFGHRALCIRSMFYGLQPSARWGNDRTEWGRYHFDSRKPHNALEDAKAQALSLAALLDVREGVA